MLEIRIEILHLSKTCYKSLIKTMTLKVIMPQNIFKKRKIV